MNAYLVSKKSSSIFEGDFFQIVGVFDSESKAASYLRSKGRYTDSYEVGKDLRECYVTMENGRDQLVFRIKAMPMNEGE